jgi:3-dehydroquinate dehydratase-2
MQGYEMSKRRLRILVLQGANMSFLGRREPEKYGTTTAAELDGFIRSRATELGVNVDIFYTNIEGEAINRIYAAVEGDYDGLLMNPAGFQYAGFALRDCLRAVQQNLPYVEVHMTKAVVTGALQTVTVEAAIGMICGFGIESYSLGLGALAGHLAVKP